ncbi:MAG: ABC transporter permease [Paracoccaceae bacterium]
MQYGGFGEERFGGVRARVIAALIARETVARFGRSWGGYFWAIGEPLGGIVLLSLAFSLIVHAPPLGTSFAMFYATGLIPFLMFNAVAAGAVNSVAANRGLFAYPVVTALDTVLARAVLETLTYLVIAALFLPALVRIEGMHPVVDPVPLALALALASALGLGVGTANAVLIAFWPTWRPVWTVLNRPLFLVSGVLFPFAAVPAELRPYVWVNPVSHVIALMRAAFYGPDEATGASAGYVLLVAGALFAAAGLLMTRHKARMAQA